MVTRAAENARLGEVVFITASRKMYVSDPAIVLQDMKEAFKLYCVNGMHSLQGMYIAHGNKQVIALAQHSGFVKIRRYYLMSFPD